MAAAVAVLPPFVIGAGRNRYPDLSGIKLLDLTFALVDTDRAIAWAMANGLIAGSRQCKRCANAMVLEACMEGDGKRWRCQIQGCRSTMSLRADSFYTKSKLSLRDSIMVSDKTLFTLITVCLYKLLVILN